MRYLADNEIPVLPMNGIIADESVAFGVFDPGVVIHYLASDKCILISWEDIVIYGITFTNQKQPAKAPVEIDSPTEAD